MSGKFVHSAEIRWFLPEQGRPRQIYRVVQVGRPASMLRGGHVLCNEA